MVFGNGVKNIQAAAYNGARTVFKFQALDSVLEYLLWRSEKCTF